MAPKFQRIVVHPQRIRIQQFARNHERVEFVWPRVFHRKIDIEFLVWRGNKNVLKINRRERRCGEMADATDLKSVGL